MNSFNQSYYIIQNPWWVLVILISILLMIWLWGWCTCKYLHNIRELLQNLKYLKKPSTYCEYDGTKRESNGICIVCLQGLSKSMAEYEKTNP